MVMSVWTMCWDCGGCWRSELDTYAHAMIVNNPSRWVCARLVFRLGSSMYHRPLDTLMLCRSVVAAEGVY